ncbi:hypothetical protein ONE63_005155 [Megalurothrips usitatus]|uniref:Uncharacterized protein n=1 Tax=Megalurothrips usitatus TaxID=439358 RepID=A0AAV7XUJ6_9NEOP|nr:hypothetical protein ONE63_005155 [Megalurothrips usitatus]
MLTVIRDYLNSLDDSKVANNVQGDLWKELRSSFDNEGKFVLPLHLEFDDYTEHSLGALYATIPCLPPQIQSSLDNIFLFTSFESKFRKLFGNRMAFLCSIKEVEFLEKDGISVNYGDEQIQVYFCCALIIADNLGFNSILGFVEGFRGNFYCRICKLHRTVMEHHCRPVPIPRMRTEVNYAEDLEVGDCSLTGINEQCVWNEMPSFYCVKIVHCDAMHDICEGMLKYDLCQVLFNLVSVRGYFSIELLIDRLQGFDYGPNEVGNKPPTCKLSLNCLEKCSWNLSSSEMLCLSRYLGEIVGDLVPDTNRVWKLYVLVREIVEILSAPYFKKGLDVYLQTLIEEHREMYIVLFGSLKPKHHLILRYPEILRRNGPFFAISSLMCERNHRKGKLYTKVCNCRVNFAHSVAVKSQLALCERLMHPDSFTRNRLKTYGVSNVRIDSIANYNSVVASLPLHMPGDIVSLAKSVQIYGTLYCIDSILVVKVGDWLPTIGKIVNIIVKDCETVIFVTRILCTLSYVKHICAFEVVPTNEYLALCQDNIISYAPLWERRFSCKSVVSIKQSL